MEGFGVECRGLFTDMGHFRSPCCGACSPSVENLSLGNYGNSEEPTTYFPTSGTTIPPPLSLLLCRRNPQHPQRTPRPTISSSDWFTQSIYYSGEGVPPHPSLWEIAARLLPRAAGTHPGLCPLRRACHRRHIHFDEIDRAKIIRLELGPDLREVRFLNAAGKSVAGIVDQNINRPHLAHDLVNDSIGRGELCHIKNSRDRPRRVKGADLRCSLRGSHRAGYAIARGNHRLGQCAAQSAADAGDEPVSLGHLSGLPSTVRRVVRSARRPVPRSWPRASLRAPDRGRRA